MATIILYGTKTGTAKLCAEKLGNKLTNAKVYNLEQPVPSLDDYSTVIIGGSIRMGKIHSAVKKYIKAHEEELYSKRLGLFLCCGFVDKDNLAKQFSFNFSERLLNSTDVFGCFGGKLEVESLKGFDKIIANMVTKADGDTKMKPEILPENIEKFAKEIEE